MLNNIQIGDALFFGHYQQSWKDEGRPLIEWIVLDVKDDQALIISKNVLDCRFYDVRRDETTWENCALRKWLNGPFLKSAFTETEASLIMKTNITEEKNKKASEDTAYSVKDRIFLLDNEETGKYFKSNKERRCAPTDYAIIQGAWISNKYTVNGKPTCIWLLRSPNSNKNMVCCVSEDGDDGLCGEEAFESQGIRPVMWINLKTKPHIVRQDVSKYMIYEDTAGVSYTENSQKQPCKIEEANIGDTILFGTYKQDDYSSDAKNAIEWQILDKNESSVLVISKYALDCVEKHKTEGKWEQWALRMWMNESFLCDAFNQNEQKSIVRNNTEDKIFLLSADEAEKYFVSDEERKCTPTNFTVEKGAYCNNCYTADNSYTCWWWLRPTDDKIDEFAFSFVYLDGSVNCKKCVEYSNSGCFRPAMWIDLHH